MFGRTLTLYFGTQFAKIVIAIIIGAGLLISAVVMIEFLNQALITGGKIGLPLLLLVLFRVPGVLEDALPFAILYGSIAAFVVANRRLEVVVARAAGVSAIQFLIPACVVGLLIGVIGTTVYNPVAAELRAASDRLRAEALYGGGADEATPAPDAEAGGGAVWVRQRLGDRQAIIGSTDSFDDGLGLLGVTVYVFGTDGRFVERVDSPRGRFHPGEWRFEEASVTSADDAPRIDPVYVLPTNLSETEVKRAFLNVESVPFWGIPALIHSARLAGVPTERYEMHYHTLIARPVLLLAMVLIAANVSLRFSRSSDLGRMIIAGVAAGFMLYVVMKISLDLGRGGVVPPPLAAWLPAIIATLAGMTVLLHLEDG